MPAAASSRCYRPAALSRRRHRRRLPPMRAIRRVDRQRFPLSAKPAPTSILRSAKKFRGSGGASSNPNRSTICWRKRSPAIARSRPRMRVSMPLMRRSWLRPAVLSAGRLWGERGAPAQQLQSRRSYGLSAKGIQRLLLRSDCLLHLQPGGSDDASGRARAGAGGSAEFRAEGGLSHADWQRGHRGDHDRIARAQIRAINDILGDDRKICASPRTWSKPVPAPISMSRPPNSQLASRRTLLPPLRQQLNVAQHALAVLIGKSPANGRRPISHSTNSLADELPVSLPSALAAPTAGHPWRRKPNFMLRGGHRHRERAALSAIHLGAVHAAVLD